jgi:hypothetical protein
MVNIKLQTGKFVWCDNLPVDFYSCNKDMYIHNTVENETYFYGYEDKYIFRPKNEDWIIATEEEKSMMIKLNMEDPKYSFVDKIIIE